MSEEKKKIVPLFEDMNEHTFEDSNPERHNTHKSEEEV